MFLISVLSPGLHNQAWVLPHHPTAAPLPCPAGPGLFQSAPPAHSLSPHPSGLQSSSQTQQLTRLQHRHWYAWEIQYLSRPAFYNCHTLEGRIKATERGTWECRSRGSLEHPAWSTQRVSPCPLQGAANTLRAPGVCEVHRRWVRNIAWGPNLFSAKVFFESMGLL